jgi:hypothetical protein
MLLYGEQGGATLVDFGGVVRLGDPIVEATALFCFDLATTLRASGLNMFGHDADCTDGYRDCLVPLETGPCHVFE